MIEDMVTDNSNNVRVVPEAERQANFLQQQTPSSKKRHKRNTEKQEKQEAALRSVFVAVRAWDGVMSVHFIGGFTHNLLTFRSPNKQCEGARGAPET